tara:strand:+ start:2796 stop:3056 length:261 start_codon:yes stop_codon:yes gene_type:complete
MNTSKKFKHNNLNEGESPEENSILDDLHVLVNVGKEDKIDKLSLIASLKQLIGDYHNKPLNEIVGGDKEWYIKEQKSTKKLFTYEN